jgi:hypothetical protein
VCGATYCARAYVRAMPCERWTRENAFSTSPSSLNPRSTSARSSPNSSMANSTGWCARTIATVSDDDDDDNEDHELEGSWGQKKYLAQWPSRVRDRPLRACPDQKTCR